jgi:purine-nucleoside phosphorylase
MTKLENAIHAAARRIVRGTRLRPRLALVLGSGFQGMAERVRVEVEIPYAKLPGFPRPSVRGHPGKLLVGHVGRVPLVVLSGRAHYYEGYAMEIVTFAVRVLAEIGIEDLLLTNAAGGINPSFRPGDFMRIEDHINLMGVNPLRGASDHGRTRFVDLSCAYDPQFARLLDRAAARVPMRLQRGVRRGRGPSYETPAEIRAFARLGADAVGMSTVPEVVVARHCGLRVAGLSCITNSAAGISRKGLSHQEVLETGERVTAKGTKLIEAFTKLYAETV